MTTTVTVPIIRSAADLKNALARIDRLIDAPDGTDRAEERTILALIVHEYESRHFPLKPATAVDMLRYMMNTHELTQGDVPEIGPQSLVSAILAGKRKLNTRMVSALAKRFQVSPAVFID
jgi:HTH-type transcriptional regulator/antitoxin HigA